MQDIDLERARLDPTAVFPSPEAVVKHPCLTLEQKTDILERWKYDACELEVAEEENMGGGEPSEMEGVLKALRALSALRDPEHVSPTKQGMIFRLRRTKRTSVHGGSLADR